ncbi:MAG: hypothetical protein J6Y69_07595 [Treponema sp.]|nr:hypothetical protein [Treponema sp.]
MAFGDDMIDGYPDGEEPLVFHHKNGEFRNLEVKQYRDLATGKNQPKTGLFRVLVSTKMNRMIFIAMAMCFGLVFVLNLLMNKPNEATVNGVYCNLSAISFNDTLVVTTECRISSKSKAYRRNSKPREVGISAVALNSQNDEFYIGDDKVDVNEPNTAIPSVIEYENPGLEDMEIESIRVTVESAGQSEELTCKIDNKNKVKRIK